MLLIGDPGEYKVSISTIHPGLFHIQKLMSPSIHTFLDPEDSLWMWENFSYILKDGTEFQDKRCKTRSRHDWSWTL